MRLLRGLPGVIAVVLSAVGIVACVAGVVVIWFLRPTAISMIDGLDAQVVAAVQRVSDANQRVQHALDKARSDVLRVKSQAADFRLEPGKSKRASDVLRNLVQEQLGPDVNDLGNRLAAASDAGVVLASFVRSLREISLGPAGDIAPSKLQPATNQAPQLQAALQGLRATAGENKAVTEQQVIAVATEMEGLLQRCKVAVDDWQSDLDHALDALPRVKEKALDCMMVAAIFSTALCLWVGAGQISLFVHGWKCFRHS